MLTAMTNDSRAISIQALPSAASPNARGFDGLPVRRYSSRQKKTCINF